MPDNGERRARTTPTSRSCTNIAAFYLDLQIMFVPKMWALPINYSIGTGHILQNQDGTLD